MNKLAEYAGVLISVVVAAVGVTVFLLDRQANSEARIMEKIEAERQARATLAERVDRHREWLDKMWDKVFP